MEDLTIISDSELRARLVEKEELVSLALRVGGIGMWDWHLDPLNPPFGGVVHWDAQMYILFGVDPKTWGGTFTAFEECLVPEDRDSVRSAVAASLDHDAPYDYSFNTLSGKHIRGKGKVFYDANGIANRMVGVCVEDKQGGKL